MDKDLERLFDNLKGTLDTEVPPEGHTERFLEKLESSSEVINITRKRKSWIRPLFVAASITVLFAVGFLTFETGTNVQNQLSEISPEVANTEFYFASVIEEQVKVLQKESTPETKRIVDDTMSQLNKLKIDYKVLEKDLLAGGNSKMILSAMIVNFQTRIDLLQEVLDKIETIKNLKQSNDENYTI